MPAPPIGGLLVFVSENPDSGFTSRRSIESLKQSGPDDLDLPNISIGEVSLDDDDVDNAKTDKSLVTIFISFVLFSVWVKLGQ